MNNKNMISNCKMISKQKKKKKKERRIEKKKIFFSKNWNYL